MPSRDRALRKKQAIIQIILWQILLWKYKYYSSGFCYLYLVAPSNILGERLIFAA
ncbi:hypothetical protein C7477_11045 [Phyllobacterium leguminum]|uniref:Uncharacterized protein n=1 Tax=Phyllobacterium leguminum TaxID=314237 RepID=A0A318T4I7_9HYPH|nr:hypothetical protein C7477_11045 [Phyllobacterium leguminum]